MSTICKDCKYWSIAEYREPFGFCASSKWIGGYQTKETNLSADMCHYEDDEGWGFVTGPEFGCIHHEVK